MFVLNLHFKIAHSASDFKFMPIFYFSKCNFKLFFYCLNNFYSPIVQERALILPISSQMFCQFLGIQVSACTRVAWEDKYCIYNVTPLLPFLWAFIAEHSVIAWSIPLVAVLALLPPSSFLSLALVAGMTEQRKKRSWCFTRTVQP